MYTLNIALDQNRFRSVDTDLSNVKALVSKRTYETVFSVTEKITGDIFKVFDDLIYRYEMYRAKSGLGRRETFQFGDKIILTNEETGETVEVFHCMAGQGYTVI